MRILKWTGGIVLALLVALVLFIAFGLSTLKGPITRAVSNATGRELVIDGRLKPVWSWVHPRFRAEKVSFANADWASDELMFQADAVEASVELLPLLVGRVVLPEVHLNRPTVNIEIDADGRKNWILKEQDQREGSSRVSIHALTFDQAALHYLDDERDTDLQVAMSTDAQGVSFNATGTYKGLDASAEGRGGQVLALKDTDAAYPLDATAKIGGTTLKAKGTLTNVAQLSALDLDVDLRGKTLSELYDVIGVALPETTPYQTRGHLVKGEKMIAYEKFTGKVGDSDLAGTLQFELGGKRAFMHGELESKVMDLGDLGFVVGTAEPRQSGVLPDMPFDSDRWDSIDADVRMRAGSIRRPKQLPLEHLSAHILMRDKVLTLEPLEFGIAGGKIAGTVKLDGQKDPIAATANLRVNDLSLPKLFPTVKEGQASIGDINGLIELAARGDSVAQMLGASNGKVGLYLDGGKISRFMMELVALDVWGAARVKLKGDEPIGIRCAIADFGVKDGLMKTNAFVFDTDVVNVEGDGTINLKTEDLDLKLNPHPKDRSIASLNSPLYIRGTFGEPKFAPDWKRLGTKGVGALAIGLLNPLLAVLPLLQEGKDKESPCAALIAEATKSARQSAAEAKAGVPRPPAVQSKKEEKSAAAGGSRAREQPAPKPQPGPPPAATQ
ncbi:MAG: AsmA family protein [Betaproteobacteria bacterium]|nr:AsmA family protein [Betaproteobacteria bacterium]